MNSSSTSGPKAFGLTWVLGKTGRRILPLLIIGILVRILYSTYKLLWGFDQSDMVVCNPDEIGYLERAVSGKYDVRLGYHWLYEWVNEFALELNGSLRGTYVLLCSLNCIISLILPILAIPVLRLLTRDESEFCRSFIAFCSMAWLCPNSIWLAGSNLKDMILCALHLVIVSAQANLVRASNQLNLNNGLRVCAIMISIALISCLRIYMAVAILGALAWVNLFRGKQFTLVASSIVVAASLLSYDQFSGGEISNRMQQIAFWDESLLEETNLRQLESGEDLVSMNNSLISILRGCLFHTLAPLPNLTPPDIGLFAVSFQTAVILFFIVPLTRSIFWVAENPFAKQLLIVAAAFTLFYGIFPSIAGPRQRFATSDILLMLLVTTGLARNPGRVKLDGLSMLIGSALVVISLLITSRGNFGR